MTFKDNLNINSDNVTKEIMLEEKVNFLLEALNNNSEKYEALPNEIKIKLEPYRSRLQKGESLTVEDYKKIKEAIM